MKNVILAFAATWLSVACTFAQTGGKISGHVILDNKTAAQSATVSLINAVDTALLKTAVTDSAGNFSLSGIKPGMYKIAVSMIGYNDHKTETIKSTGNEITLPLITLVPDAGTLSTVSVTAKKQFVEKRADRTIVNVDALISNTGITALEVLEKSPGILVDDNGNITLKGKQGTAVFIDGKPTYMSGADLQNYLRSLPSSSIDQIEIMTNPPAKYDAAGSAGAINIKTKKLKTKGFNGNLSTSYNQGTYTRTLNTFNFNYRDKKLNLFGSAGYTLINGFSDLDIYRRYKNPDESTKSFFMQNTFLRRKGNAYTVKAGADFYADAKTTWGIVLTGQTRPLTETNDNVTDILNPASVKDSTAKALNIENSTFKNAGINFNYRKELNKPGNEITADVDYINYSTNNNQTFYNTVLLPGNVVSSTDMLTGKLPATINILSAKTDYSKTLSSDYRFSAGLKYSYTKTDNRADYYATVNNITKPDYDKSNHFIYSEQINAAYVNMNKDFKKLSVQTGLRFENTVSDGHQTGNIMKPDSSFKRNYTSLFPTFYILYKLDSAENNQVSFNYGRRIERPYYQDLNPFISPLDKFTYYAGNPFLKPAFTNSFELSHTYKNKITTTLSYSKVKNSSNETIEIVDGIYYSRPGNIGTVVYKSLSVDGSLDLKKWLSFYLYTEVSNFHSKSKLYATTLDSKGTFWSVKPNVQLKFKKGWSGEISGNYRTDITDAQFISYGYGRANVAVSKKFSAAASVKLSFNDIFYSTVNAGVINNLYLTDATYSSVNDTRQVVFTLSYRFGKVISDLRKHDASGADAEKNRVKKLSFV